MDRYVKPVILANEELAEGVYAASGYSDVVGDSGSAAGGSGSVSVSSVTLTSPGNAYYKVNGYKVTIENSGNEESSDWTATVSVTAGTATAAKTYNTYQANVSLNGSTITITPGAGGTISAGGTIDVDVVVDYSSDSITVE